jgi:hypothetical protein
MKYVAKDIAESYQKMSASIFTLNQMLSEVLKNQQKLNATIDLNDRYKVDDVILKLKDGLNGWSTWCLQNKTFVNDHLVNFLHFRKHELMALKELSIQRQHSSEMYKLTLQAVQDKKMKLFTARDIEKWGTHSSEFKEPVELIMKDFNIASKYILPKENEKLAHMANIKDYFNQSVYLEYILFNKRDQKRIVKNFKQYAKKAKKSTQKDDIIWNIFENARVELSSPLRRQGGESESPESKPNLENIQDSGELNVPLQTAGGTDQTGQPILDN